MAVMAHRSSPLRLRLAEGELTVSVQTPDIGEARESLPAGYSGDPLEIGFNAAYLQDGIESVAGDEIQLRLINPLRPGLAPRPGGRVPVPDHAHPAAGLIVSHLTLRDFRSYAALDLELAPGLILASGPNGAGKTNLLESLHVATQGYSPRTRLDANLVRFGSDGFDVRAGGLGEAGAVTFEVAFRAGEGKRAKVNGTVVTSLARVRTAASTLVFTPDRLAVVKAGPAVRRAYFDRVAQRLYPARATLASEYAEVLAQRNAALRRAGAGAVAADTVEPWSARLVEAARALREARAAAIDALSPRFAESAGELGLDLAGARL